MQRLGRTGRRSARPASERVAPAGELVRARPRAGRARGTCARAARSRARCRRAGSTGAQTARGAAGASPRSSSGRGCRRGRRAGAIRARERAAVRQPDAPADGADRLLLGPSARPRDARDRRPPCPRSKRSSAPVRHRLRHRLGHRAVRARSAPGRTPSSSTFASFEYATTPPATYVGRARALGQARRQQPGGARLGRARSGRPASRCSDLVVDARAVLREDLAPVPLAQERRASASYAPAAARLEARDHLDLAAPQAGGDLELVEALDPRPRRRAASSASPDSGQPEHPHHRLLVRRSARRSPRCTGSLATAVAPHRLQLARRPGQHHHRRRARARPRPAPCPTGSITYAPSGISACLRFAARTASKSQWLKRAMSGFEDRGDLCPRARRRARARGPLKRATISTVMSSAVGPEPAARDDQVDALGRPGSGAAPRCPAGRSPQIVMCASSTPSSSRRSDEPGPVAVADPAGQHLGAGHDDARASAHAYELATRRAARRAAARACAVGVNSKPDRVRARASTWTGLPFIRSCTSRLAEVDPQALPAEGLRASRSCPRRPRACRRRGRRTRRSASTGTIRSATRVGAGGRLLLLAAVVGRLAWSSPCGGLRSPPLVCRRSSQADRHEHRHHRRPARAAPASPGPSRGPAAARSRAEPSGGPSDCDAPARRSPS